MVLQQATPKSHPTARANKDRLVMWPMTIANKNIYMTAATTTTTVSGDEALVFLYVCIGVCAALAPHFSSAIKQHMLPHGTGHAMNGKDQLWQCGIW